ncbi:hypothetical protein EV384_1412 [Micromonospora kangleipakensis]|uniref:Uncharacterized protein n=1 Tax=Micromonospora kangleipakensis TaxID=1077942 RepID=A0A4Q8B5Y2_9ACTN|nr:hypothetical protein EV384_1412 [Micromonospora kangleipakensis]
MRAESVWVVRSVPARYVRWLRTVSRTLWLGLQHCGASYTGLILPPPAAAPDPEGAAPTVTAPASGHPERLAAHVPMSPVEERLWADLGHHRREA